MSIFAVLIHHYGFTLHQLKDELTMNQVVYFYALAREEQDLQAQMIAAHLGRAFTG